MLKYQDAEVYLDRSSDFFFKYIRNNIILVQNLIIFLYFHNNIFIYSIKYNLIEWLSN